MQYRFDQFSDEFSKLPPKERIKRCRALAAEAKEAAIGAAPNLRATFLDLAEQWSKLADELEHNG